MALNGFNSIAWIYEPLARMVFGNSIREAQLAFISALANKRRVLILGGGTGWYCREVLRVSDAQVVYVEASSEMIRATKKRLKGFEGRVAFIHGTEMDVSTAEKFDAIVCNFYFDLFTSSGIERVMRHLRGLTSREGVWIVTEFVTANVWWQSALLAIMYRFFRLTCGIEARSLPDWLAAAEDAGIREREAKTFFRGFIRSAVFKN